MRSLILACLAAAAALAPLALGQGQGLREIVVFNPLPYPRVALVPLNLSFLEGEAYNGTLTVVNASGAPVPLQLVNCTFYPSGYYRSCSLVFPAALPAMNATRYVVMYRSAPPAVNVSRAAGLSVRLANLTLLVFNATGSYALNVTNAIVVRGPGYLAVFSNASLLHLAFDGVGGNLAFADWPFVGFVLLRNLSMVAGGYDLATCRVRLLMNGSLVARVEQVCGGKGFTLRQTFTFSGLAPVVRVDAVLEPPSGLSGTLFLPYLRLLTARLGSVLVNGSELSVSAERTFVPAPRWLAFRGERGWLVVAVNYTSPTLASLLDAYREQLWRAYVNETNPLRKELYSRLLSLYLNFSSLLRARERVASAAANLTVLRREARALSRYPAELGLLLRNFTSLLEAPEGVARRLLLIPQEGTLNVAYQLAEWRGPVRASVVLAATGGDPSALVRALLLYQAVEPATLYSPIEARLEAPRSAYIDDFVTVTAIIRSGTAVRNVSVALLAPARALPIVAGSSVVNFTSLSGEQRIRWVLSAVYEGRWAIALNVTSPWGTLLVVSWLNVTLPPIVPRVVIPRSFNVTVLCVDTQGRPLAGYLVNLYENATRRLVYRGFTNESGLVRFLNVSAGAYLLEVTDGLLSVRKSLLVYSNRNFTVTVGLAKLRVRVEMADGTPLPSAAVFVRDETGSLACAGFTDARGFVNCTALPTGNYTVSVQWQGSPAGSTVVSLTNDTTVTLRAAVRRVTVYVSYGARPAVGATVAAYSLTGALADVARTDERGVATFYLLAGPYRFTASRGQYVSAATVDTRVTQYVELQLALTPSLWVLMAATGLLWALTAYVWRQRTSYLVRERERYRRLLQRLEELHSRGEVEEVFYVKLKREYEAKLNELSRGEEV